MPVLRFTTRNLRDIGGTLMKRVKQKLAMLLVCCMVFTFLPITAKAENDKGGIYDGEITSLDVTNFYDATGVSINGNFEVRGVAVDAEGKAWCILASTQTNGDKHGFLTSSIDGVQTVADPHYKKVTNPGELTLVYPDKTTDNVTAKMGDFYSSELYVIEVGTIDELKPSFVLGVDSSDNGWDIIVNNPPVEMKMGYDITKTVDKADLELLQKAEDRTLTYTVQVSNTGDHPVFLVNVFDSVPEYLTVQSITAQNLKPEEGPVTDIEPKYDPETGKLVLDTDITLTVGYVKEYTIKAVIDENYKGGTLTNVARIESTSLLPDEDSAETVVHAYFYVHHIFNDGQKGHENGVQMREDKIEFNDTLRNGSKFDVTTANSADTSYQGMWDATLYGGTFKKTGEGADATYTDPYEFSKGENGIGFTPEVNEHYYVWEPTNKYMRPLNMAVWHTHGDWFNDKADGYHTIAGYPFTVVDRKYYQQFGFVENREITEEDIYESVTARKNFDGLDTSTLKAENFQLTGFLGCYKLPGSIFTGTDQSFLPYWVTNDGVKVTGIYKRTASYNGIGLDLANKMFNVDDIADTYTVEAYTVPRSKTLMVNSVFCDNDLTLPLIPETVGVAFESTTAGNSGNVKEVKLAFDLSEFNYDRAWFEVNGEVIKAQKVGGLMSATISNKKDAELTVVPRWSYGGKEFTGAAKLLSVTKKNVKDITPAVPVNVRRMSAASFRSSMSMSEDNDGVIIQ